jgi:hypothetical protein
MKYKLLFSTGLILLAIRFFSFAQAPAGTDLYSQTSEMNDMMVHYSADKESIMRFYSTSDTQNEWWNRQGGNNYNSPERRQRLLQLNSQYLKQQAAVDFDKMSINGKVDYLLFKRNLEDEQYQLQEEEKLYGEVKKIPFLFRSGLCFGKATSPRPGS